jgi:type IV secretory pathway TraG/TraD family ATPase VirD4
MEKFVMYIKKNRIALITIGALWLLAEIFVISAIAYAMSTSITNGVMNGSKFIEDFVKDIASANSFGKVFSASARGYFGTSTLYFTLFYIICVGIGLYKARRKNEYDKIEHGSSDWSENGEQYRVISKNAGLILAEKNYLPLNKVGNVNVLIVCGSGSGKSSSYTIPNAHQCLVSYISPLGSVIIIDSRFLASIFTVGKITVCVLPDPVAPITKV